MCVCAAPAPRPPLTSLCLSPFLTMPLTSLLAAYDHVLLDLDGCVWVDDSATPHAREALAELRAGGKTLAFVTNDSRMAPEEYVRKLWSLGLQAALEEIVTVGSAIQYVLAGRRPGTPTYVIGSPAIFRHVADSGQRIVNGSDQASSAEVVVVAGHDGFSFEELRTATRAVLSGAEMLATDRDRTFPAADGYTPGTGAIVAALEYATGRTASSVGKPETLLFETALDRLGPGRSLMIGDRLDADLLGAAAAGLDAAIVLTGVTDRDQAQAADDPAPVAVAETLYELVSG
jgi:glycerol 3-phosphatase-2